VECLSYLRDNGISSLIVVYTVRTSAVSSSWNFSISIIGALISIYFLVVFIMLIGQLLFLGSTRQFPINIPGFISIACTIPIVLSFVIAVIIFFSSLLR